MIEELGCPGCGNFINVCGECKCEQAFGLSDLDQRQRDDYRTGFLEIIRYIIRNKVPNPSPENHDWYHFNRVFHIAFEDGLIDSITDYVNGVRVALDPRHSQLITFMEPAGEGTQVGESSNSADDGGVIDSIAYNIDGVRVQLGPPHKHFNEPGLRKGSNSAEHEVGESSNSADNGGGHKDKSKYRLVLFLRLRVTFLPPDKYVNLPRQYLELEILGKHLDWEKIHQDVESNTLELKWNFYKIVVDDKAGNNGEETTEYTSVE